MVAVKEKPFTKMTKAEKRVSIAQDVLARLKQRKLSARQMTFVSKATMSEAIKSGMTLETELRDALRTVKRCEACALGACFIAAVDRFDKLKIGELDETSYKDVDDGIELTAKDTIEYLQQFFTESQVKLIEQAFERGNGWFEVDEFDSLPAEDRAVEFGKAYKTSKKRLVAIMENIIANNGTFRP